MKYFILLLLICSCSLASSQRILQILRILADPCNNQGYLYKNICFCLPQWTGPNCTIQQSIGISDIANYTCDDYVQRLDYLDNISPTFYLFDDDLFPRIVKNSIDGTSPGNPSAWISMHDMVGSANFHVFSREISALDIGQGALGDCYLLSAYASLANRNNGSVLRNLFVNINDNPNHVYTSRWMINGKPRYVAVDDWVPGYKSYGVIYSSYSHVQTDGDTWPLILEKAYAKIHGNYKIIEGGLQTSVWSSMTQAPSFYNDLSSYNVTSLFAKITQLFKSNFVVGTGTSTSSSTTSEVKGHAYAVLGAYNVTLDNGSTVALINYYNPWHSEVWTTTNPWNETSPNWTPYVKTQVPFITGNDGIVFSTVDDFLRNFVFLVWGEIHDDYDVSFIDIPLNYVDNLYHNYKVNFTYYGTPGNDLYVFIDLSDGLIFNGCGSPVAITRFSVTQLSTGQVTTPYYSNAYNVKLANATQGTYTISFNVMKKLSFIKYITMTAYSQAGSVNFVPQIYGIGQAMNLIKQCPNNCNLQGLCDTYTAVCTCFFGFTGSDCSKIVNVPCSNCSAPAVCDTIFGLCFKPSLFNVGQNKFISATTSTTIDLSNVTASEITINSTISTLSIPAVSRYVTLSGTTTAPTIILSSLQTNVVNLNKQIWNKTSVNADTFILTSASNTSFALSANPTTTKLSFSKANRTDPNQQWKFLPFILSCPKNCSSHGTCSYSTGKCVCGTGYVGDACELVEQPVQCPNNCSKNGVCAQTTGTCNCNSNWVGQGCDIFYQDLICPNNCSGLGTCDLTAGKCVCSKGMQGVDCKSFSGMFNYTLKNLNNSQYLSFDTYNWIVLSVNASKWNVTSDYHLLSTDGRAISMSGTLASNPSIIIWTNYKTQDSQQWQVDKVNNYYAIRSSVDLNYVLALTTDKKKVTTKPFNISDTTQLWSLTAA